MKKIFGVFLCSALSLMSVAAGATEVDYNGNMYDIDTVNDNGTLYIPLELCKDTVAAVKNINGSNYVSLRDAVELSGKEIQWNSKTKSVEIIDMATNDSVPCFDNELEVKDSFTYKLNNLMPLEENYNFSPISIKIALAMLANGAEGETRNEITNVLEIEDLSQYNDYVKKIIDEYSKDEAAQINITNSMWFNSDKLASADINSKFVNLIRNKYNGVAEGVSLSNVQNKVDLWIQEATKGEIDTVAVSDDFFVQLINATYFKGEWENKFDKKNNINDIFTDIKGNESNVEYMNKEVRCLYYADNSINMISLPYKSNDNDISMYIAVSDKANMDFEEYINKMYVSNVDLYLPKFQPDCKISIKGLLLNMGIKTVFTDSADLSNIINEGNACVSGIEHRSKIKVDEEGTVASAYTNIIVEATSAQPRYYTEFKVNKPFTFFIRDNTNNEILFIGRCNYINN